MLNVEEVPDIEVRCAICRAPIMVRPYMVGRRKYCSDKCKGVYIRNKMREYRETERGKIATREMNKRYKVPDKLRVCKVCGAEFYLARVRNYCDKCKEELHG